MKRLWLALALALFAFPTAAWADTSTPAPAPPGHPAMTPAQRQAMYKTFSEFRTKEIALHKQLRSQVLDAISPAHRNAIAQAIGDLAVSASPDPGATARHIDAVLSPSERQAVMTAQNSFAGQNRTLMQQMHAQMVSEMPSPPPGAMHPMHPRAGMSPMSNDAGTVVLMVLSHSAPMGMLMRGFGMNRTDMEGPPPPR